METPMEYARIEREMTIDARPDVVYEVITQPDHIRQWWFADTDIRATPGATGELVWSDGGNPRAKVTPMTVVAADPPRRFSFRWAQPVGETATASNSLLVTFELEPVGTGTVLRFTEAGFRDQGWEPAEVAQRHREHEAGWDRFLPGIETHAVEVVAAQ